MSIETPYPLGDGRSPIVRDVRRTALASGAVPSALNLVNRTCIPSTKVLGWKTAVPAALDTISRVIPAFR